MNRREFLCSMAALSSVCPAASQSAARPNLQPSPALVSRFDRQTFEFLDVDADTGPGLLVRHRDVTIRHCRVRHRLGPGIVAYGASGFVLRDCDVEHVGPSDATINVAVDHSPGASIKRLRAAHGSSNIYAVESPALVVQMVELHDARGPAPRGQNVQFDKCPGSTLEDFSAENSSSSWTEDNVSVFRSSGCSVRRGLVSYNNSPTGDGVMIEGSLNCVVEDVDAVEQGNGAFAAVPQGPHESGGCRFVRCRTKHSYNSKRDGRDPPSSNGLSFYMIASNKDTPHSVVDCCYDQVANPHNIVWKTSALAPGWTITQAAFTPRAPLRLNIDW